MGIEHLLKSYYNPMVYEPFLTRCCVKNILHPNDQPVDIEDVNLSDLPNHLLFLVVYMKYYELINMDMDYEWYMDIYFLQSLEVDPDFPENKAPLYPSGYSANPNYVSHEESDWSEEIWD